ncbi:MAG: hypothetical protein HY690_05050 [Chloroflexi bacterium]|nr:hypothetical protein [Chloroflexota bacterium]
MIPTRQDEFKQWLELVASVHRPFRFTPNQELAWTPLRAPLAECQVALVTTAGLHRADQPPFEVEDEAGDWSVREIPDDTPASALRFSHTHYDTRGVDQDPNVAFPLDRLHDLVAEGFVGRASPVHFGFMGYVPNPAPLRDQSAPEVARRLKALGTDVVVLTPG